MKLSPQYATAAINLADLYRQIGRDGDGESVLRKAIAASSADAAAHHALGLTLTRMRRPDEAFAELRRATELEPDRSRYAYVYAVALHSGGRADEAMKVLKEALERHPNDRDVLSAQVSFNRATGDAKAALGYAERLAIITPEDRNLGALSGRSSGSLTSQTKAPGFLGSAHKTHAGMTSRDRCGGQSLWSKLADSELGIVHYPEFT
ncbi:tetratricopeptide repeat protein [Bradyrhizobium symbiodeficiens]